MEKFVAFLRGINSGSNPTLKMELLRKIFEDMGFNNVKTVLATGNVLFENHQPDAGSIEDVIEAGLAKRLGYKNSTVVKSSADIERLIKSNPFRSVEITPQTRLYITFVKDAPPKIDLELPYSDPIKGFTILGFDDETVRSVVDLKKGMTPDLMDFLDKKLGKRSTTRNWNTIQKIQSMLA